MELFLKKIEKQNTQIQTKKAQSVFAKQYAENLLETFYNHKSTILKKETGEPYLKDNFKYISISHSNEYIAIAFDDYRIGIDIEKIKQRDISRLLKRYNLGDLSLKEFYQWWTKYEAEYKSQLKQSVHTFELENYICTVSHNKESKINIIKDGD